jgi:aspartate 1-decarboxylase
MSEAEARIFKPALVYLNEANQVIRTGESIPAQAA